MNSVIRTKMRELDNKHSYNDVNFMKKIPRAKMSLKEASRLIDEIRSGKMSKNSVEEDSDSEDEDEDKDKMSGGKNKTSKKVNKTTKKVTKKVTKKDKKTTKKVTKKSKKTTKKVSKK